MNVNGSFHNIHRKSIIGTEPIRSRHELAMIVERSKFHTNSEGVQIICNYLLSFGVGNNNQ